MSYTRAFSLLAAVMLLAATPSQAQIFVPTEDGAALQAEASTTAGASWADYDDDGDLDVAVTDVFSGIQLFRNDGGGEFLLVDLFGEIGNTYSTTWSDLDGDGDLDLLVNSLNSGVWLHVNLGEGSFAQQPLPVSTVGDVRDVSPMDVNRDGLVDLFVARRFGAPNELLRNEGELSFSEFAGFYGLADNAVTGVWGDYNGDGNQDLYTTEMSDRPDRLYWNSGEGLLDRSSVLVSAEQVIEGGEVSQSANWIDIDRDGDLDLYVGDLLSRDAVYRNDGLTVSGVVGFSSVDVGSVTGNLSASLGSVWGDVDNDGDVDLVVSTKEEQSVLHLNDGFGNFESQSFGDAAYGVSPTLIDYDGDGDLDLFIPNGGANFFETNELFRNTTNGANNWLQIRCIGTVSNRSALGTRVRVPSVVEGEARWQVREVQARSGRQGQSGLRVHFGLAEAAAVDSVVVTWPSGIEQVLEDVAPNQELTIVEEGEAGNTTAAEGVSEGGATLSVEPAYPNPFAGSTSIRIAVEQAGPVSVSIYDVLGRRVRTLLNREIRSGSLDLTWDARDDQGAKLPSGTYFVRVAGADRHSTAAITLVK